MVEINVQTAACYAIRCKDGIWRVCNNYGSYPRFMEYKAFSSFQEAEKFCVTEQSVQSRYKSFYEKGC